MTATAVVDPMHLLQRQVESNLAWKPTVRRAGSKDVCDVQPGPSLPKWMQEEAARRCEEYATDEADLKVLLKMLGLTPPAEPGMEVRECVDCEGDFEASARGRAKRCPPCRSERRKTKHREFVAEQRGRRPVITCSACKQDGPHGGNGWCEPCNQRWHRAGCPASGPPPQWGRARGRMQERIEEYLVLREQEPKLTREQIAAELGVTRQALWHWDRKLAAQNPPIQGVKSDDR